MSAAATSSKSLKSSEDPEVVRLQLGNFREWRKAIRHIALEFGQAGEGLRTGVWPVLRQPTRNDLRMVVEPIVLPHDWEPVISERRWDELLVPLVATAVDANDEARIVQDFENLYERVYRDQDSFDDAHKEWRKDARKLRDSTPLLMKAIVDTISKDALEMLEANPLYVIASDAMDILGIMKQAEVTLGLQGTFSLVAVETAYDKLTQAGPPALKWSAYTNQDADYRAQLASLGHPVPPHSATIRYLTRLKSWPGDWDAKVASLLGRVPLPTVAVCVVELQAQIQLMRAMQAARGTPREVARAPHVPTAAKSDTPVMAAIKDDKGAKAKGDDKADKKKIECWNCGKLGHSAGNCRVKRGTCTICSETGHLAEFHDKHVKYQQFKADRKHKKKSTHANVATIDASDDDNNFMSWAFTFQIEHGNEDEDRDWELVEVPDNDDPYDELQYQCIVTEEFELISLCTRTPTVSHLYHQLWSLQLDTRPPYHQGLILYLQDP